MKKRKKKRPMTQWARLQFFKFCFSWVSVLFFLFSLITRCFTDLDREFVSGFGLFSVLIGLPGPGIRFNASLISLSVVP